MNEPKFGQIIEGDAGRDAVHVAVTPAIAGQILAPGEHVGFLDEDGTLGRMRPFLGVVDPFLTVPVFPRQRFWLFLYPQTITGLRHVWTHPAFSSEGSSLEMSSKAWLLEFAGELGITYTDLISACEGVDYCFGHDTPDEVYRKSEEMWRHYEIVSGKRIEDHSRVPFRCAC